MSPYLSRAMIHLAREAAHGIVANELHEVSMSIKGIGIRAGTAEAQYYSDYYFEARRMEVWFGHRNERPGRNRGRN